MCSSRGTQRSFELIFLTPPERVKKSAAVPESVISAEQVSCAAAFFVFFGVLSARQKTEKAI